MTTTFYLGEHLSLKDKGIKYDKSNLNNIRHLLDQKGITQSSIQWEVGLREPETKDSYKRYRKPSPWTNLFIKPLDLENKKPSRIK